MKKDNFYKHAIFLILISLIAIPLGLFILMELFGYKEVNQFFKDHGSLIAGILGFVGVFILVSVQKSSTKKQVDATMESINLDHFQRRKESFQILLLAIIKDINLITLEAERNNKPCERLNDNIQKLLLYDFAGIQNTKLYIYTFWSYFDSIHKRITDIDLPENDSKTLDEIYSSKKQIFLKPLRQIPQEISDFYQDKKYDVPFDIEYTQEFIILLEKFSDQNIEWITKNNVNKNISKDYYHLLTFYLEQSSYLISSMLQRINKIEYK